MTTDKTTLAALGLGGEITMIPNEQLALALGSAHLLAEPDRSAVFVEASRRTHLAALATAGEALGAVSVNADTPPPPAETPAPVVSTTVDPSELIRALDNVIPLTSGPEVGAVRLVWAAEGLLAVEGCGMHAGGRDLVSAKGEPFARTLSVANAKALRKRASDARYVKDDDGKLTAKRVKDATLDLGQAIRGLKNDRPVTVADMFEHLENLLERLAREPAAPVPTPVTLRQSLLKAFLTVKPSGDVPRGDDRITFWRTTTTGPLIGVSVGSTFRGVVAPVHELRSHELHAEGRTVRDRRHTQGNLLHRRQP